MDAKQRLELFQEIAFMSDHQLCLAIDRQELWEQDDRDYEALESYRLRMLKRAAIQRLRNT